MSVCQLQGGFAVLGLNDFVGIFNRQSEQAADIRVVVDHQDFFAQGV
jgi:hypothetical protein